MSSLLAGEGEEGSPLLGTSAPSYYTHLSEDKKRPLMPRVRSNSVAVYTEEEDVVFTSYGPVVVEDQTQHRSRSWLLGWVLAILSGVLFTANNFLVKYYTIEAVEMLLVRSCLQTILMALVIGNKWNPGLRLSKFSNFQF